MSNGILKEPIFRERLYPNLKDWSIYKFHKDRAGFIKELNKFSQETIIEHNGIDNLGELINKCIYQEESRLRNKPWKVDPPNEGLFWKKIKSELQLHANATEEAKREIYPKLLHKIINRYSEEIVGDYKMSTFLFARKFTIAFFGSIYNKAFRRGIPQLWWSKRKLLEKIKVYGELDTSRALFEKGTVIVVPTHSSNIDSIQIGFLLDFVAGFPHFSYGAGLNLYNSEIAAYYMNRLGAYRVDRRKKNVIYLETLKAMSQLAVQKGLNNLFFPGGTRSRSGEIESQLKKGLLSTLVEAQRANFALENGNKVFIVPLVLSYHQVFEVPELIDQHLRSIGREKYISSRPKPRNFRQILNLLRRLTVKSNEIYAYFSHPLDVFGNKVDVNGNSLSDEGETIDIREYFITDGKLIRDSQRESVYTSLLADRVKEKFYKNNIVLSSQALAYYMFEYWIKENKGVDFFEFLRLNPKEFRLSVDRMPEGFEEFIDILRQKAEEGLFHLAPVFAEDTLAIIEEAVNNIGVYHVKLPLYKDRNGYLRTESLSNLFYYRNRLNGYGLEKLNCFK